MRSPRDLDLMKGESTNEDLQLTMHNSKGFMELPATKRGRKWKPIKTLYMSTTL